MDGPTVCEVCDLTFEYQVDGSTYTHLIGVEVQGVYDGVLYWMCPRCESAFHRWPEGHRLHKLADPLVR